MRAEVDVAAFEFVSRRSAPMGEAADPADVSNFRDRMRRVVFEPYSAYCSPISRV